MAEHSSDHAVTIDSMIGLFSADAALNAASAHSRQSMVLAKRQIIMSVVIALRYVYVLALSIWFGGIVVIGGVATPVSDEVLHRFFLVSYAVGGLLLVSLFAMALLGPRPSGFAAR